MASDQISLQKRDMEYRFTCLLKHITEGRTVKDACNLSDISPDTYYRWVREVPDRKEAIDKAISTHKRKLEEIVERAAENNATHAEWLLEKRHRADYGKVQTIDSNVAMSGEVSLILTALTDADLATIKALQDKARGYPTS